MFKDSSRNGAYALLLALLVTVPALGGGAGEATDDEALARMETLLVAQQQRLSTLQQQVAGVTQQGTDAARTELMKQQIREVLSEQEFRESLMPSTLQAGYDDGFFIRSSDDKFKMVFNGFLQFRWTHYGTRKDNRYLVPGFRRSDRTGFDVSRARLIVSGHAYDEDLTYYIHLISDGAAGYNTDLLWGWVNYRFCDAFNIQTGLYSLPGTRGWWLDERGYQFVSRSMVDQVFNVGDGLGVMFWGSFFDSKLDYYLSVSNSLNGAGQTINNDEDRQMDSNPAIVFKTVWHALGEDPGAGLFEGDTDFLEEPALDIGFHYAFNEDDGDGNTAIVFPRRTLFRKGGYGLTNSLGLQVNQFGFDAQFKYMGFSAAAEYIIRILDVREGHEAPFAPLYLLTGDDSTNAQHGAYVQCGYFLPIPGMEKKLELVARVGGISALSGGQEGSWEYTGGLNYYFEGHNVKLQTDVTKIYEVPVSDSYTSMANVNDDALVWRVQLQVAF